MFFVIALAVAIAAGGLHIAIFLMESVTWTSAKTRKVFSLTEQQALATKEMAFNQGFYNLFLAIVTFIGAALALAGHREAGLALVFAGIGSMFAAALVLFISAPDKRGAALKQGSLPLAALVLLGLTFVIG